MITSPEKNVELTDEQTKQLLYFEFLQLLR